MDPKYEEELVRLAKSIQEKTARLRSQIDVLESLGITPDSPVKLPPTRRRDADRGDEASISFVSVNYGNEALWFSTDDVDLSKCWNLIKRDALNSRNNRKGRRSVKKDQITLKSS